MKEKSDRIFDEIYRRLHPRQFPFSPWERQMELRDLWPADQEKFREMVRAVAPTTDGAVLK